VDNFYDTLLSIYLSVKFDGNSLPTIEVLLVILILKKKCQKYNSILGTR